MVKARADDTAMRLCCKIRLRLDMRVRDRVAIQGWLPPPLKIGHGGEVRTALRRYLSLLQFESPFEQHL